MAELRALARGFEGGAAGTVSTSAGSPALAYAESAPERRAKTTAALLEPLE